MNPIKRLALNLTLKALLQIAKILLLLLANLASNSNILVEF